MSREGFKKLDGTPVDPADINRLPQPEARESGASGLRHPLGGMMLSTTVSSESDTTQDPRTFTTSDGRTIGADQINEITQPGL